MIADGGNLANLKYRKIKEICEKLQYDFKDAVYGIIDRIDKQFKVIEN